MILTWATSIIAISLRVKVIDFRICNKIQKLIKSQILPVFALKFTMSNINSFSFFFCEYSWRSDNGGYMIKNTWYWAKVQTTVETIDFVKKCIQYITFEVWMQPKLSIGLTLP